MIFSTFDAFANINERLYATPDNYCKNGIIENLTYSTHTLFLENNIHGYDIASELFGKVVARVRGQGSGGTENIQANAPMPQPPRRDQSRTIYDHMW